MSLIEHANQLKLEVLGSHLLEKQQENKSFLIQLNCQKHVGNIMRKRKTTGDCVAEVASRVWKVSTRTSAERFNWKFDCLFCGKLCIADQKHPERRLVFNATFLHYRETILKYCSNRRNDKLPEDVKWRVLSYNDVVYEEVRYHDDCQKIFPHPKDTKASSPRLAERPRKENEQENFIRLCEWLEELHEKMKELAKSNAVYSSTWFK